MRTITQLEARLYSLQCAQLRRIRVRRLDKVWLFNVPAFRCLYLLRNGYETLD